MSLATIYKELKPELNAIEKRLEEVVAADQPVLRQAAYQLLKAGGKRIRPIFVLLSSQYGNREADEIKSVAVTLELIHMASLVHDDVIDDAELRRGQKTVKARFDNRVAMYTGDFIFAKALHVATSVKQADAHGILSNAMMEMALGEIIQIEDQFNWHQNLRNYLLRIKRKTALLMAVSCQLGAMAAKAPDTVCRDLYDFGYYTGMSFQITDDILDFIGTEKQLGKPAASDIRQGNVTLPTLIALRQPELQDQLLGSLVKATETGEGWDDVIRMIVKSGGIEASQALSTKYLNKAYQVLKRLPEKRVTKQLERIADYIGKRKY